MCCVLCVLHVLYVLRVLHVLNKLMDASLACWALLSHKHSRVVLFIFYTALLVFGALVVTSTVD